MNRRCAWAADGGPLYQRYHDKEWGMPVRNDRKLFEFLILEGAQARLSWSTILNKRANYRLAYDNFDARRIARYNAAKVRRLLRDPGIVRNRLKIRASILNARAFLQVQKEYGSFNRYIWEFVGGKPVQNRRRRLKDIPARTKASDAMSRDLKNVDSSLAGASLRRPLRAERKSAPGGFLSAQRFVMPSCRPWAWSMTIPWIASGTARSQQDAAVADTHGLALSRSAWIALLTLLLSVAACSFRQDSPEAQVRGLIKQAESAAEKKESGALRGLVSENYSDSQGQDKKAIEAILRYYFLRHESIHLLTRIQQISFPKPEIAQAVVMVAMAGQPISAAEELERVRADLHRFEITLASENKEWKVIRAEWRRAEFADFL